MTGVMNVLAFDTCWKACSAAIVQFVDSAPTKLAHRFEEMATGQAETLPVMLADVLQHAELSAQDIHRVAVANGPGSFTGVRIGIAAARALKLSSPMELVTCSSLEVLALRIVQSPQSLQLVTARAEREVIIAMDARRDEVYVQVFSFSADELTCTPKTDPQILPRPEAVALSANGRLLVAGTGAEALVHTAQELGREATVLAHPGVGDALDLAHHARRLVPLREPLMPVYLRPPDAKPSKKPAIQRTSP